MRIECGNSIESDRKRKWVTAMATVRNVGRKSDERSTVALKSAQTPLTAHQELRAAAGRLHFREVSCPSCLHGGSPMASVVETATVERVSGRTVGAARVRWPMRACDVLPRTRSLRSHPEALWAAGLLDLQPLLR